MIDFAQACLDGGARLLQVRAKQVDAGAFLAAVETIVARAAATDPHTQVIVNDRADIARLARAQGVHVGQDDLGPAAVRQLVGDAAVVGLSTHTDAQLDQALATPSTYVAIGPVFSTETKATGYTAVGVARVRHVSSMAAVHGRPVVAIGGITLEHAPSVIDAGASAVAVISDLLATGDPTARVRDYLRRLGA